MQILLKIYRENKIEFVYLDYVQLIRFDEYSYIFEFGSGATVEYSFLNTFIIECNKVLE